MIGRSLPLLALVACVYTSALSGCTNVTEADDVGIADDELQSIKRDAHALEAEVKLLMGSDHDIERLVSDLDAQITRDDQAKDAAATQAERDVAAYSAGQWSESWYTRDEITSAVKARSRDIFARTSRRRLAGTKVKRDLAERLLEARTSRPELAAEADRIVETYAEVGSSIILNRKLGIERAAGAVIVGKLGIGSSPIDVELAELQATLRRNRKVEGGVAGGNTKSSFRDDPRSSTMWHARRAEDVTPERLHEGPWYKPGNAPNVSLGETVWELNGFRARDADGAHASVELKSGDTEIKLKLSQNAADAFLSEPARARLMWALGYETDPQELLTDIRMQPRAYLAAIASAGRVFDKDQPNAKILPGRPTGLVAFHGLKDSPGSGFVSVHFKDGSDARGDVAIDRLKDALHDRPLMDSMEYVTVHRAYAEVDPPAKREGIGPWHPDSKAHIQDRELRALKVIFVTWLRSNDFKFANVRLDVEKSNGPLPFVAYNTISDVGGGTPAGWELDGKNLFEIDAFDPMDDDRDERAREDAKWAVSKIAALTEEQILACVSRSAFTPEAAGLHTEMLIARRDLLVKKYGLHTAFPAEFRVLRPAGPNKTPAPRTFAAR